MNEIAKKITESLRLRDVMEFYGVQFNSRGFAKCPFHTEKTASLSIKNEHYKCFGCGAYGSVIDFVMNYYGLKFMQAVVKLDSDFHLGIISGRRATYRENAERASQAIIERAYKKWQEELHQNYLTVCIMRRALYSMYLNGEEQYGEMIERFDMLLDDFTGEGARAWQMAIIPPFTQKSTF